MDRIIEIPKAQVIMAFVATCIEATARLLGTTYKDVYLRMKRVGLIENYIIPHYETLHSESRENIAAGMVECLNKWEGNEDPIKSPEIQEIILSNRIGAIAVELAKRLNIEPSKALQLFYESQTCADLHDKSTGLYLYGDLYIADEFMREKAYD